ncbi:hypothetical protein ACFV4P_34205 [Kitasatospora sp. NPDC059795]|uniref:hypothetical protein n=1 Tax=Kitasatospora sp. NPDC059795 TaxID=3346949 RepID=UPI0036666E36
MARYVITEEDAKASWWDRNKAFVCTIAGLAVGIGLMGGFGSDAVTPAAPTSSSSTPAPTPTTAR